MNINKDINNIVKYHEKLNNIKGYEYRDLKKIKEIIRKIDDYYEMYIPADYLIKRLSRLELILDKIDSMNASITLGIVTSFLVNIIFQLFPETYSSKSGWATVD